MTSVIDICNRALLQAGVRTTIAGFPPSDTSPEAQACATLFQPTFEQLARTAQWNCLRKQASLSMLKAALGTPENPNGTPPLPPIPWLYEYAYPADCLDFSWIVPNFPATSGDTPPATTINNSAPTWLPSGGQIRYAVAYDTDSANNPIRVILTNQDQALGVYVVNEPNPQQWDSLFQQAIVAALAAYLVPALSLNIAVMQLSIKVAEEAIAMARARDGNEGVTTMDHVPDWIAARAGAQGYGYNGWGWTANYLNMCWPIGVDY